MDSQATREMGYYVLTVGEHRDNRITDMDPQATREMGSVLTVDEHRDRGMTYGPTSHQGDEIFCTHCG